LVGPPGVPSDSDSVRPGPRQHKKECQSIELSNDLVVLVYIYTYIYIVYIYVVYYQIISREARPHNLAIKSNHLVLSGDAIIVTADDDAGRPSVRTKSKCGGGDGGPAARPARHPGRAIAAGKQKWQRPPAPTTVPRPPAAGPRDEAVPCPTWHPLHTARVASTACP
jgi:hypothetical protein